MSHLNWRAMGNQDFTKLYPFLPLVLPDPCWVSSCNTALWPFAVLALKCSRQWFSSFHGGHTMIPSSPFSSPFPRLCNKWSLNCLLRTSPESDYAFPNANEFSHSFVLLLPLLMQDWLCSCERCVGALSLCGLKCSQHWKCMAIILFKLSRYGAIILAFRFLWYVLQISCW